MRHTSKKSDKLRDQEEPRVFGILLDRKTLTPVVEVIAIKPGDHGCDPLGDGTYRMVPSGDVVSHEEKCRRLPLLAANKAGKSGFKL